MFCEAIATLSLFGNCAAATEDATSNNTSNNIGVNKAENLHEAVLEVVKKGVLKLLDLKVLTPF